MSQYRPITHEAVQRALKTNGFVFFKAKVANPCKFVVAKQTVQQVLQLPSRYQHGNTHQRQAGTHKIQAAAGLVTVLC